MDPQKFMSVSNVWVHVNLCMLKMHIHPGLSCHVYAELIWEKGRLLSGEGAVATPGLVQCPALLILGPVPQRGEFPAANTIFSVSSAICPVDRTARAPLP